MLGQVPSNRLSDFLGQKHPHRQMRSTTLRETLCISFEDHITLNFSGIYCLYGYVVYGAQVESISVLVLPFFASQQGRILCRGSWIVPEIPATVAISRTIF